MSRRKQACPVRAEAGNRHLSVEPGSSGIRKSKEPDSSIILPDECDLNISAEVAHAGHTNVLSDEEFVVTGVVYSEPKSSTLAYDEQSFHESETKPQVILPSVKVEPLDIHNEEHDSVIISPCNDPICIIKEEGYGTSVAEKKDCEIVNVLELKPLHLSNCAQSDSKEDGRNADICMDVNVTTGSETKVIPNTCVEKVELQCATSLTQNAFEAHKKQLHHIIGSLHKNHDTEMTNQRQTCTEQADFLEAPLQIILPCVEIDPSLFDEEPEAAIISPCQDAVPIIKETNLCPFSIDERADNTPELKPLCLSHSHADGSSEKIDQNAEICTDFSNKNSFICKAENEGGIIQSVCVEKDEVQNVVKCAESKYKPRKKQLRKFRRRRSHRKRHALKTENETQETCTEYSNILEGEEIQLHAILPCVDIDPSLLKEEEEEPIISSCKDSVSSTTETNLCSFPIGEEKPSESSTSAENRIEMCLQSDDTQQSCDPFDAETDISDADSNFETCIPDTDVQVAHKPCVTDEEIRCMVDFTKEALDEREKKLQQIREAVYKKRALETDEQRQARLEKDKLRQRKRRAEETEEQREKRLLTMRLHKRIKRSMHSSSALQKNFLDYYMEEMFQYPETQEEQGSPLNMIVSIDPSWVVRTVERQQFRCAVETQDQRKTRLEKDMLRQRKKRAEETTEQRAKRLETMRINKRIRRAMETDDQRHRRLEYSRERQLYRRLNETEEQRKERLEREKLRQREKRASESSEERAERLTASRERMRERLSSGKIPDMFDNLQSSDSLSS